MIARYWSARTSKQNVLNYARHLAEVVAPDLRKLAGFRKFNLLTRNVSGEVEILVITYWDSLDCIQAFAGADIETAVVADEAAALLTDFDRRVRHYDVLY